MKKTRSAEEEARIFEQTKKRLEEEARQENIRAERAQQYEREGRDSRALLDRQFMAAMMGAMPALPPVSVAASSASLPSASSSSSSSSASNSAPPKKYIDAAEKEAIGRQFTAGRPKEAWVADYAAQLAKEAGWRANDAWLAGHDVPSASSSSVPHTLPSAEERARAQIPSHYTGNSIVDFINQQRMMHDTMRAHNPAGWVPFDVKPPNPAASASPAAPTPEPIVPAYHGHRHRPQPHAQPAPQAPAAPLINPALSRSLTIQMPSEQSFGGNGILQMLLGNAGGAGGFSGGDWGIAQQVPVKPRMSISDKILRHFAESMYHPEKYPEEGEA
jgi:hypothetical protein